MPRRRLAHHLAKDERGVSAVEFALIAPVMLLILLGFMEYSHLSTARNTLESATMRAARAVSASECPTNRQAILTAIIQNDMKYIPAADNLPVVITSKAYSDKFGDVGEPEPFSDENSNGKWDTGEPFTDVNGNGTHDKDMGTLGSLGGVGQVVTYTATYQVKSLFGYISNLFNNGEDYTIEASTVIRNEPIFRTSGCT